MAEPVTSQFMVFFFTIMTGMLAGFLYDVYAGAGHLWGLKKNGIFLGDVLYWACATVMVYALLLKYNQGEVRFFVLLGISLGALCYFRLSRRRMRHLIIKTMQLIIRLINWLVTILLFPIRLLYIILTWPFKMIILVVRKIGLLIANIFKLLPAPIKRLYRRWQKWLAKVFKKS